MADIIKAILQKAVRKPSSRLGPLVLEVDDHYIGQKLREFREEKSVQASDIAKSLKLSKATIHFLEHGERRWTLVLMKKYVQAIEDILNNTTKNVSVTLNEAVAE